MDFSQIYIPILLTIIAGMSTVLGSLIFFSPRLAGKQNLSFFLGLSAGVMIYLSFIELIPFSIKYVGFIWANLLFFTGIAFIALIDFLIPHHYLNEKISQKRTIYDPKLFSVGLTVAIGLVIHNIPEGMAVFISSFADIRLGFLLAFAIAIHNIPEGIAVATPIYHATRSRKQAFKFALISGMAEPLGAIIAFLLFRHLLTDQVIAYIFATVAGIMTYISFDELLPACYRENNGHRAILGIIIGMLIVFLSLSKL